MMDPKVVRFAGGKIPDCNGRNSERRFQCQAMTLQQIEEYHANVQSKIEEAANYLRAKDQEIHFVKDRKDRQEKRLVSQVSHHFGPQHPTRRSCGRSLKRAFSSRLARDKALETAYQHQIRFKQFLEMGATMEEAMGLANGFASPELKVANRTIPGEWAAARSDRN